MSVTLGNIKMYRKSKGNFNKICRNKINGDNK